ncbi:hypothetical protein NDU88_004534 [Pleurodeles waltl]|uniref:Uncharacterized protein n=1 Tax=Pleurodeles waltl TaxID=8319 RepID=A0AAV7UIG5_PLEWA|nr:hypothetical protein NDU88_004534 [Pleurodeles waltl]
MKDKHTREEARVVISAMFARDMGTGAEIVKVIEVEEIEMTEMTGMREKIETIGTTWISIGQRGERDDLNNRKPASPVLYDEDI